MGEKGRNELLKEERDEQGRVDWKGEVRFKGMRGMKRKSIWNGKSR